VKYLVAGARGQLGEAFAEALAGGGQLLLGDMPDFDLTDSVAVAAAIDRFRPDVIVNCAAFTDVDGAEHLPLDALRTNALAVRALSMAASRVGATLVHFSTDFVFDGRASAPYDEDDTPNPESVYAASKLLGEDYAQLTPRHYVLRLSSLFGGSARRAFVDRIIGAVSAGKQIDVFENRFVSPSYTRHVVRAALSLVHLGARPGVYHCTASGYCSWLELAREIERQLGAPALARGVPCANAPGKARRPKFCALSNARLRAAGVEMPSWQATLAEYLAHPGIGTSAPPGRFFTAAGAEEAQTTRLTVRILVGSVESSLARHSPEAEQ
jgi:dTDP-4-dehydrorhamnose reductase